MAIGTVLTNLGPLQEGKGSSAGEGSRFTGDILFLFTVVHHPGLTQEIGHCV